MTRLVSEEQAISSNSDSSCGSSRASSQCFDLDTSSNAGQQQQQGSDDKRQQKRLLLSSNGGESDQEPAAKRIALDPSKDQSRRQEVKLKDLQEDANKPKRNPFCSRCRNHGKIAQVKGHKRHCDYRDCQCEGCKLVECRQIVSARQIKLRRNQKQDEEYGRRIEVSPPVLRCDTNNDSLSIFAKTLIGATSPATSVPNFKPQLPASTNIDSETDSTIISGVNKQQTTLVGLPSSGQQPALKDTTAAASTSGGGGISSSAAGRHQQLHPDPTQLPPEQATAAQLASQRLMVTAASAASDLNCEPTLNPALAVPFHLFNLPAPMLSQAQAVAAATQAAAAAASLCKSTQSTMPATSVSNTCTNADAPTSPSTRFLPSIHEQINLVEEIYHTYGPLAIYAWLKYEHFDLQKIRDSIELSRSSYDNLLNLKLMSHLGVGDQHHRSTTFNTAPNTTTSSVGRTLLQDMSSSEQKNCLFKSNLPTTSNHSSFTSMMNLHQPNISKTSSDNLAKTSFQSAPPSTLSSASTSLINSYHSMNRDVRTTQASNGMGTGGVLYGESPSVLSPKANHMSLEVTLNHIPKSSSDFPWPRDLKMPTSEGLSVIRPGHLFSRFMHYQHISEAAKHKAHLLHHHLNLQQQHLPQQHHHHQNLSATAPFATNLSMPSSAATTASSSTTTLF